MGLSGDIAPAEVRPDASGLLEAAAGRGVTALDEAEAKALLASIGLSVPRGVRIATPGAYAAALTGLTPPFAIKALSSDPLHKSDLGAVALNLPDASAVADAMRGIAGRLDDAGKAAERFPGRGDGGAGDRDRHRRADRPAARPGGDAGRRRHLCRDPEGHEFPALPDHRSRCPPDDRRATHRADPEGRPRQAGRGYRGDRRRSHGAGRARGPVHPERPADRRIRPQSADRAAGRPDGGGCPLRAGRAEAPAGGDASQDFSGLFRPRADRRGGGVGQRHHRGQPVHPAAETDRLRR